MKILSSQAHGVLDYMSAGMLLALPTVFRMSKPVSTLLTGAGVMTLFYSAITRYEFSLAKVLPFRTHLLLDRLSAASFIGAPLLLREKEDTVNLMLAGIGVFELAATLLTDENDPIG